MERYIKKHKGLFILVVIVSLIATIMNVGMALVFKEVLDSVMTRNMELFIKVMVFYIAWEFTRDYLKFTSSRLSAKFLYKTACSLRTDIFSSLLKKDIGEFKKENSGKYIANLTNDVSTINVNYFDNIFQIIEGLFSLVLGAVAVAYINIYILIGIILFAIINMYVSLKFGQEMNNIGRKYSNCFEMFTQKIKDMFEGFEVIRSFNIENRINEKYLDENGKFESFKLKGRKKELTLKFSLDLIGTFTFILAIGIGGVFTIKGTMTVGALMAATQLMNNIMFPIVNMGMRVGKLKSTKSVAKKLDDIILNTNNENCSNEVATKNSFDEKITFNNVNFGYKKDALVLKDLSFKLEKGKKYAIIGKSGCGKTTVLKLILKYYKDFTGDIKIDDTSINDIDSSSLYKLISTIHQNVFMFDGTIKDNITLFKDYNNLQVEKAIKASGLEAMINNLPDKENTLVGENGCNLSGGEKQRLAIARALIKKTPILILDEATSSLDNVTSHEIQKTVLDMKDLTCITITHSFSEELLRKYDDIFIIDDGCVTESGTFEKLMDNMGYFYNLYSINNPKSIKKAKDKPVRVS